MTDEAQQDRKDSNHDLTPRRTFLAATGLSLAGAACSGGQVRCPAGRSSEEAPVPESSGRVALAQADDPSRNGRALLDAWGGVESLIGPEDVVVFKANAQWYAQGMTNTDVLESLVRAVLERPGGFRGEIAIADNHHFKGPLSRGWTTDRPNGGWNLADLVRMFREEGHEQVCRVHWRDAGPNPDPWQGNDGGGTRVFEPGGGDGYRWWLEECHVTPDGNRCAMTWPVFSMPLSGDVVDLKDGVFRDGAPTGRPIRLINISSLNHHSRYAGVTASIKNLMGIVDMTCGFQGPEPPGYFNTHYIGMRPSHGVWRWAKRRSGLIGRAVHKVLPEEDALDFHHTGGALGHWMRTVRRPDLHVVTAEWIGFGSRTVERLSTRPGVSLASDDPVTLDAVAGREVLMPATRQAGEAGRVYLPHNDPDAAERPFRRFLQEARREVGGRLDPDGVDLVRTA